MKIRPLPSRILTQDKKLQSLPFPNWQEALPKYMSQGDQIFNSRRGNWRPKNPWNSHTNSFLQIAIVHQPVSLSVCSHQYPFFTIAPTPIPSLISFPITSPSSYFSFHPISTPSNPRSPPQGLPQDLFEDYLQDTLTSFFSDCSTSFCQDLLTKSTHIPYQYPL